MSTRHIWSSIIIMILTTSIAFAGEETLKDAFRDHFYVGAAFGRQISSEKSGVTLKLISEQFNSVSSTNDLKWQPFNPEPDTYNHEPADLFVDFGVKNKMYVVGHVFFWHNGTPDWVFKDSKGKTISRKGLLKRMRDRVRYLAKRYKGKIHAWDVVNESFLRNGALRKSEWVKIIGDDYIEQAFRIADEELPKNVELIYNDFGMTEEGKRGAVVAMVKNFKKKGVRIDGIGMQGHWSLEGPSIKEIETSIIAFATTGVKVHISEHDIDVLPRHPKMWSGNADIKLKLESDPKLDPYKNGLPNDIQKALAKRYASVFQLFMKHSDKIKRVTFWGPTDKHTWLNNRPIKGRTNYPLLFDRAGRPKPAFDAVIQVSKKGSVNTDGANRK